MEMTFKNLRAFLGWCLVINLAILLYWFLAIVFAHDLVFKTHSLWFTISEESFDAINYTMMIYYKLAVMFFNLVPYLVLRWVKFK
jgi:hypothetical protein